MTVLSLILVLAIAGLLAWPAERLDRRWPRWLALAALGLDLVIVVGLWSQARGAPGLLDSVRLPWVPQLGINLHLGVDGLSLLLVALTLVVGVAAVVASWQETQRRVGPFHAAVLWSLAGMTGVFVAFDLFLFYFFWELMLLPTYFLYFWGRDQRLRAALKFFIFTQFSGLLMLLAIIGLYLVQGQASGNYSFDYYALLAAQPGGALGLWLFLGFWVAFAVKLPVVPFHTWLPDAYAQAPTAGTIILAGAMAKTAGYGLIRFAIPFFPEAAAQAAPYVMALATFSILYAAQTAFGQTDFKRLVAYSSVSAMGFVMLGAFARDDLALQGVTMQMVAHGLSTGALFFVAGALQQRLGGTGLRRTGGLWATAPRLGGLTLVFALATLGLPGLGNFVGEFLVLLGSFRDLPFVTGAAALGVVLATVYALWLIQRVFQGPLADDRRVADVSGREAALLGLLLAGLLWLGLLPQQSLDLATPALSALPREARAEQVPLEEAGLLQTEREYGRYVPPSRAGKGDRGLGLGPVAGSGPVQGNLTPSLCSEQAPTLGNVGAGLCARPPGPRGTQPLTRSILQETLTSTFAQRERGIGPHPEGEVTGPPRPLGEERAAAAACGPVRSPAPASDEVAYWGPTGAALGGLR